MKCSSCGARATRRIVVTRRKGPSSTYVCCDTCEPRDIPQGDVISTSSTPI